MMRSRKSCVYSYTDCSPGYWTNERWRWQTLDARLRVWQLLIYMGEEDIDDDLHSMIYDGMLERLKDKVA